MSGVGGAGAAASQQGGMVEDEEHGEDDISAVVTGKGGQTGYLLFSDVPDRPQLKCGRGLPLLLTFTDFSKSSCK